MSLFARSLLTAAIPLSLLGIVTLLLLWTTVLPGVEETVLSVALEKQRTIEKQVSDFVKSRRFILETLARELPLESDSVDHTLAHLKDEQKALSELFEGLYLNRLDGTVYPTQGEPFNISDRPYYSRMKSGQPVIGEVLTSRATQKRILLLIVPVKRDGKLVGGLGGTVLLKDLFESIAPASEKFHLEVALLQGSTVLEGFPQARQIRHGKHQHSIEGRRITRQGETLRAWSSPLPEVPWCLVLAWPEREMLGPIHETFKIGLAGFGFTFLLASGLSLWLQRSVTKPLKEASVVLSEYQGDTSLSLNASGPKELGLLLGSINTMSEHVSKEMTRRLELEQQLSKLAHQASMGTLVDSIAHDFNNLLSAIINLSGLHLEELDVDSELHEDLTTVLHSGQLGVSLIKQLRHNTLNSPQEKSLVTLDEVLPTWADTLKGLLPTSVSLTFQLGAPEAQVEVSSHQLFQIVLNLVCNARDALRNQTEGRITIGTSVEEGFLILCVADNGPGIPREVASRVFEPFFTTRSESGGSGLGLSTCHRLVCEMKGEISLQQDNQTRFTVRLPLYETKV